MRLPLVFAVCLLLTACGGGGGGTDDAGGGSTPGGGGGVTPPPAGGGGGGGTTLNPGPQIALLMVNGHAFGTLPNYLATATGPFLDGALVASGYTVETSYYVDDAAGYAALLLKLQAILDTWITNRTNPTRIVIVPHSHGGVRSHSAIRAKPLVPVRLLADLDTSSNGWGLVHPGENAALGGAPIDAHVINGAVGCAQFPLLLNEAGTLFDVEDVVFDNVQEALEVRTGDVVPNPLQVEMYDERWNARLDGSQRGLWCHWSATLHSEPTLPAGVTLPFVRDWILGRLATDP